MTATLSVVPAQQGWVDFFIHSQGSHVSPPGSSSDGSEPDGLWWNPHNLFRLPDQAPIAERPFSDLLHGFKPALSPDQSPRPDHDQLVPRTSEDLRTGAYAVTFTADKSVSALWAMAHANHKDLHHGVFDAHHLAVRAALLFFDKQYRIWPDTHYRSTARLPSHPQLLAGSFTHGDSPAGHPHLHTHCLFFNMEKTHAGACQAICQDPFHFWPPAVSFSYQAALTHALATHHNLRIERYGGNNEHMRIKGLPERLISLWTD